MTPALFNPNAGDAFDLFIGSTVSTTEDLYYLDGEMMFRRSGGFIETFDAELGFTGGQL